MPYPFLEICVQMKTCQMRKGRSWSHRIRILKEEIANENALWTSVGSVCSKLAEEIPFRSLESSEHTSSTLLAIVLARHPLHGQFLKPSPISGWQSQRRIHFVNVCKGPTNKRTMSVCSQNSGSLALSHTSFATTESRVCNC